MTSQGNNGGIYRANDVDILARTGFASNDHVVFNARAGEWLEYTVNVASTGFYNIGASVSSRLAGGTFHIESDGINVTGALTAPTTGSWYAFQSVGSSGIYLTAGTHILRLSLDTNGVEGIVADFDTINITSQSASLLDDFNDNVRDSAKWNVGILTKYPPYYQRDSTTVAEANQRLEITPRTLTDQVRAYNGYVSTASYNLTGARAVVELTQMASRSQAYFSVGTGSDSHYRFFAETSGGNDYIDLESQQPGNEYPTLHRRIYNIASHRFLSIRHDPATDQIIYETKAHAASNWIEQLRIPRGIYVTNLKVELMAGTFDITATGIVAFDNVRIEGQ